MQFKITNKKENVGRLKKSIYDLNNIPYKKPKGNAAKKRLRVYISVPEKYQKAEHKTIETALAPKSLSYYTTIGELCSSMGWRKLE